MSQTKPARTDDQSWSNLRADLSILGLDLKHQIEIYIGGHLDDRANHIGGKLERTTTTLELLKEVISSAPPMGEFTLIEVRTSYEYNEVNKILQALVDQGYLTEGKESYFNVTYPDVNGVTRYFEHGKIMARFKISR